MTAHALVQGVLAARRDLRLKHELVVLDVSDAMTILVTPPPHPERSTDGPWLGPTTTTPRQLPRSALADHNVPCHLVHDNHDPKPGRSTDGTWPDNPSNGSPTHQGGSHDETQEDQEPYSTNRGRWGDVDVVDGRI